MISSTMHMLLVRGASIVLVGLIVGCASTHNMKSDGFNILGGGFQEELVVEGLYRFSASSNKSFAFPSFEAAKATWDFRADQLCGKGSHRSFGVNVSSGDTTPVFSGSGSMSSAAQAQFFKLFQVPEYNATLSGYLLCDSAGMTVVEAVDYIHKKQMTDDKGREIQRKAELDTYADVACAAPRADTSSERYLARARILRSMQRFGEARECFFAAQAVEPDKTSRRFRDACEALGLMYEAGLGVEKNIQSAREWYRKAGLL